MSVFDGFLKGNKEKLDNINIKTPRDIYNDMLKTISGTTYTREVKYDIFYQIIAFQGICGGVGCSTTVANVAYALAKLGLNICVVDTSILQPVQDILLKTDFRKTEKKNRVDWFDLYRTKKNVLNISSLDSKIGVLSFQDRDLVSFLSSEDNEELVELAFSQLHSKFDLILIDSCPELSTINVASLQQSHKIIQVWSDTPHVLDGVRGFIANNMINTIPIDKMRNVVTNIVADDIPVDWTGIMKEYGLNHLANMPISVDVNRLIASGKLPFNYPSTSTEIQAYNDYIAKIVCNILNIDINTVDKDKKKEAKGTVTSNDIEDGKVEGTLHKKLKDEGENQPKIYRGINAAVSSLENADNKPKEEPKSAHIDNTMNIEDKALADYQQHLKENENVVEENNEDTDGSPLSLSDEIKAEKPAKKHGLFGRKAKSKDNEEVDANAKS